MALRDRAASVLEAALEAVRRLGVQARVVPEVCRLAGRNEPRLRALALSVLGSLEDPEDEVRRVLFQGLCDADDDVRVITLTGAGRGFCSGLDLKDAAAGRGTGGAGVLSPGGGAAHISTREIPTVTLHQIDKPVICAINGAAAGYGLDLALGCDIRLMSDRAKLLPGFARRGNVPESGGTWFLPRLVGWAKACEIGFLADRPRARPRARPREPRRAP